jgi:hypothetical protein
VIKKIALPMQRQGEEAVLRLPLSKNNNGKII